MSTPPPIEEDEVSDRHDVEPVGGEEFEMSPSVGIMEDHHEVVNLSSTDSSSTMGNNGPNDSPNVDNPRMTLLQRAGQTVREKGVEAKTKGAIAGAKLGSRLAKGLEKLAAKKHSVENEGTGTIDGKTGVGVVNPMKTVQGFVRSIGKSHDIGGENDGSNLGSFGANNSVKSSDSRSGGRKKKQVGIDDSVRTYPGGILDPDEPSPPLSPGRLAELTSVLLTDSMVFWVTAFSIAASATYDHWERIVTENSFPLSVVLAWSLFGFAIGVDVDAYSFFEGIKRFVVDFRVVNKEATESLQSRLGFTFSAVDSSTPKETTKVGFFDRFFWGRTTMPTGMQKLGKLPGIKVVTALRKKQSRLNVDRKENKALENTDFLRRLGRFGRRMDLTLSFDKVHKRSYGGGGSSFDTVDDSSTQSSPDVTQDGDQGTSQDSTKSHICMSKTLIEDPKAIALLQKVVKPQCDLRGLDLFRTDNAESDMLTHPFLIENGLRDFPTFMINIITVYGNIIVYFKLPDWVNDWENSLVEKEGDALDVKALKRFLSGDSEYRKRSFKIMPELVVGPTAVKMMAPRNKEFCLELPPFMVTSYNHEVPTKAACPAMSLTLDLLTNSTMRGLVGIFKRNMSNMTVDFACIIDGKEDDKATCVLGLWRMDHINVEDCPFLPDRFATSGVSAESIDSIRGSLLVKKWRESFALRRPSQNDENDEVSTGR